MEKKNVEKKASKRVKPNENPTLPVQDKNDAGPLAKKAQENILKPRDENTAVDPGTASTSEISKRKRSSASTGSVEFRSRLPSIAKAVRAKKIAASSRAGIVFPVGRIKKYLKRGNYAERIGPGKIEVMWKTWCLLTILVSGAAVYLASCLEYLTSEIMIMSGDAARANNRKRIIPRSLYLAIQNDAEFSALLRNVTLPQGNLWVNCLLCHGFILKIFPGGVLPRIHTALLPKATKSATVRVATATVNQTYSIDM